MRRRFTAETLENRWMPATALPDIALTSAMTPDSRSVVVNYQITGAEIDEPITLEVYRSADAQLDGTSVPVASLIIADPGSGHPTLDQAGAPATAPGKHSLTIALPNGLPPNPEHPFVLVVADPQNSIVESNKTNNTASFRTYTIGIITHGGIQPKKWTHGPPWELMMAADLRAQGYDAVIPYNWVAASNHAGAAARQAPRLVNIILAAVSEFPANDPVDLHFIGHSEGAVINSQAALLLDGHSPAQVQAGYLKMTLLDPHAANNGVPGQQYSVSNGIMGLIARASIDRFQSRAKDPAIVVPPNVDSAEVFYQHTPVSQTHGSNHGWYNLWGQVPVHGPADYFDVTGPGISHAGSFGVQDWYRLNVVPTLGDGEVFINSIALTGSLESTTQSVTSRVGRASYGGTAEPGATVHLFVKPLGSQTLIDVGDAIADVNGSWAITTRNLVHGRYRAVATENVVTNSGKRRIHVRPTAWLGTVEIS
jgi:hypothetical protein